MEIRSRMGVSIRPVRRDDVVFRPLAEEWVILDPVSRELHVLNLSAALLWEQIDGARTPDELAEAVWGAYSEQPALDVIRKGVVASLADFRRKGLLT